MRVSSNLQQHLDVEGKISFAIFQVAPLLLLLQQCMKIKFYVTSSQLDSHDDEFHFRSPVFYREICQLFLILLLTYYSFLMGLLSSYYWECVMNFQGYLQQKLHYNARFLSRSLFSDSCVLWDSLSSSPTRSLSLVIFIIFFLFELLPLAACTFCVCALATSFVDCWVFGFIWSGWGQFLAPKIFFYYTNVD